MASIQEYYITGDDGLDKSWGTVWQAMTFTTESEYYITAVRLKIDVVGSGDSGDCTVSIKACDANHKPTGADLCSHVFDSETLPVNDTTHWETINFDTSYLLSDATEYAIVVRCPDSGSVNDAVRWRQNATDGAYSGGGRSLTNDSGGTWDYYDGYDKMFETWGVSSTPSDKVYTRSLVAIAGEEVWYESTAGTMTELTDANGEVASYLPLSAVEAYEKLFIVNGSNLKVADFVNVKISTADIGANLPNVGNTLTGGTSGATMIVDYIDGNSGAVLLYGRNPDIATFISGETVTGTNDDGNAVSFDLDDDEDSPPHWYDWTVYADDSTNYGTMPTNSTLIALYRGRIVTNDTDRPQAWYMTKVGEPFKFLYDYTNDGELSALAYSNSVVGRIGDILTALIAYQDDLLVFGCANSIWVCAGDPMSDGQIIQLTKDTGIWGSRAWCFDDRNNFYFFGNDGLYRSTISTTITYPENISKKRLPDLVKDLDLDKDTHRLVLSFDPIEQGVIISKTTLDGGSNENYFYSLLTGGFFPETYPNSCGIYSSYFYPALDETYKKFLVGGTDGYIREFDPDTKNDATTSSTSAISSYVTVIKPLGPNEDVEGMLKKFVGITSGGASSGAFSDTDAVSYALHRGDDAETVLEDIMDGATAFKTGTWSTTGKQNNVRPRMRGTWMGLKLYNSTASQTWSIEKIYGDIIPKGVV